MKIFAFHGCTYIVKPQSRVITVRFHVFGRAGHWQECSLQIKGPERNDEGLWPATCVALLLCQLDCHPSERWWAHWLQRGPIKRNLVFGPVRGAQQGERSQGRPWDSGYHVISNKKVSWSLVTYLSCAMRNLFPSVHGGIYNLAEIIWPYHEWMLAARFARGVVWQTRYTNGCNSDRALPFPIFSREKLPWIKIHKQKLRSQRSFVWFSVANNEHTWFFWEIWTHAEWVFFSAKNSIKLHN